MINRRRHERVLTSRPARIVYNYSLVVDCRIRDLSTDGACLELPSVVAIPDAFDLITNRDEDTRTCRVVWRIADRIGVSFG